MLVKVAQLLRVGRFQRWDAATAGRVASKLARLTLIFGRNASGKSTLVRTLRAAATANAENLLLDRTLDATQPPHVQLDFTAGPYTFDGAAWQGVRPTIHVFDRKFVEDNVFRTQILQIALGAAMRPSIATASRWSVRSPNGRGCSTRSRGSIP